VTEQPHDHDGHHDHGAFHGEARPVRILVVCTGNSARSILGEAMFRHLGGDRVEVHSAGTHPVGLNPRAIAVLREAGINTEGLRSKAVTEYLGQSFDYVITVCDSARDACPVFPGVHETMHWSYPDPAAVEGSEEERLAAFRSVLTSMGQRIHQFLPLAERYAAERRTVDLA
jgi:arsenate reductase